MARRNGTRRGPPHNSTSPAEPYGNTTGGNTRRNPVQVVEREKVRRGRRNRIPHRRRRHEKQGTPTNAHPTTKITTSHILSATRIAHGRPHRIPKDILENRSQVLLATNGGRYKTIDPRMRPLQRGQRDQPRSATTTPNLPIRRTVRRHHTRRMAPGTSRGNN